MASVFILGPSQWAAAGGQKADPMRIRRRLAAVLAARHDVYLMEDIPAHPRDRDLTDKFLRILAAKRTTDVVIYWPHGARMQTTLDEVIHLRHSVDAGSSPRIWLFAQKGTITITGGRYCISRHGVERSRYLDALDTLCPTLIVWTDDDDLTNQAARLVDRLPIS